MQTGLAAGKYPTIAKGTGLGAGPVQLCNVGQDAQVAFENQLRCQRAGWIRDSLPPPSAVCYGGWVVFNSRKDECSA